MRALVYVTGLADNPSHQLPALGPLLNDAKSSTHATRTESLSLPQGAATESRARESSVFQRHDGIVHETAYIPIFQALDHWVRHDLVTAIKGRAVAAALGLMQQWRELLEWASGAGATQPENPKWISVMLALRSCNNIMSIVRKMVPFSSNDAEVKKSKVLKRIYEVRVQIRKDLQKISKATGALLKMDRLPFHAQVCKYVLDRAAVRGATHKRQPIFYFSLYFFG